MPRKAKELSALQVRRLEHPGGGNNHLFPVGGVSGLGLQITPTGARSWILRATIGGKRRWIGLGPFPEVSLAAAREDAAATKRKIRHGHDPIAEREIDAARRMTFEKAMDRYLAGKLDEFRNEKHRAQWRSTLHCHAVPILGQLPVADITVRDVLRVLEPIWMTKTETASRLRGRIEAVLAWAAVSGYREGDNPARWKGNLDAILPKPGKVAQKRHHGALRVEEASLWFDAVSTRQGHSAAALRFLALTCARSGEVRGMTYGELDLERRIWTIPAKRMKAQKEHRVPLCDAAFHLLARQLTPPLMSPPQPGIDASHNGALVFPGAKGGELSDMALSAVMRKIAAVHPGQFLDRVSGRPAVPHGLRSTFRDWAAERGVDHDLAEIALAHTVGSEVERAYRRTDLFERRRKLAEDWCAFLTGGAA